ncbi:MAG: 23S rRNA (guanosine(2251)-2'-O)-methyltransferase RlmB [Sphaerochaetaceae bacterium]|jgi:23S rRNA (guanosine2251-2'-O)-methyltransferase|nr:23S rRNA (guanosine(2251)-2'-O)-methyltransferase RlmB [Sphaerochaetaceae bacterium]
MSVIIGHHAIEEALKGKVAGSTLYLIRNSEKAVFPLEMAAKETGKVAIRKVTRAELDKLCGGQEHRGAVLVTRASDSKAVGGFAKSVGVKDFCKGLKEEDNALVLVLDGITDPHNLGAILRSCDQFSVSMVVVPERRSASANQTVLRISSGASAYVNLVTVTNINRELETLKDNGFWVYGADMDGDSSYETKFSKRSVIVMGSEGSGMNALTASKCDHIVSIPMNGHIDSLNVSVAAGILMYEYRRSNPS